jgi:hypothetical protein
MAEDWGSCDRVERGKVLNVFDVVCDFDATSPEIWEFQL